MKKVMINRKEMYIPNRLTKLNKDAAWTCTHPLYDRSNDFYQLAGCMGTTCEVCVAFRTNNEMYQKHLRKERLKKIKELNKD